MSKSIQKTCLGAVSALALLIAGSDAAVASTTQPAGINLGATSFNDGFGAPGSWVYEQYFQIYEYNGFNDSNGKAIGRPVFNNPHVQAFVSLNQVVYVSPFQLFGGKLGVTGLLPLVDVSDHFSQPNLVNLKANGFGLGDLTWGPFLQMPPTISDGRPVFTERFEFDVISPIGTYNKHADINQSAGFWSINPYWALTVLPVPKLELTARLHYLYNFENSDPASSAPLPEGSSYQAGQSVWSNFDASYTVAPGLDLAINGYYFQQITQDKTDGVTQSDSETTNFSIGPGLFYAVNPSNLLFANAYLPVVEKNTTSGFHLVFRWVHFF